MKHLLFATSLLVASSLSANVYMPAAKLAGETVSVVIREKTADVSGVYQFEGWEVRDELVVYFPIYSIDPDPIRVLAASRLTLRIRDQEGTAEPCPAPVPTEAPAGAHVHWFRVRIDVDDEARNIAKPPPPIHVTYAQSLIGGLFYYLPILPGVDTREPSRSWRYQLHARSATHRVSAVSRSDSESLGEALVVYLRHAEPVSLK